MIAIAALASAAVVLALAWWYDSRKWGEWEDLLSPAAREAHAFLKKKYAAEERVAAWALAEALASGPDFLAGAIADRLALLRRLVLYERMAAAIAPPPARARMRLLLLRRSFLALLTPGRPTAATVDSLRALDAETLDRCGQLFSCFTHPSTGGTR